MKKFTLRLTDKDYEILNLKAISSNLNKTDLLRLLIRTCFVDDLKDFDNILKDLLISRKYLTNSLNQLARAGHDVNNFREVEKELIKLWQSLVE